MRAWLAACAGVLLLGGALTVAQWWNHIDDGDAQLYQVVARNMVEDGTWLKLRYLPGAHAQFREHLPFGLWPMAATIRLAGEGALPVVPLLFTLGTIAAAMWIGWRLGGPAAAVVTGLLLAVTESFIAYGGRTKLDPPLVFFATVAVAPLLAAPLRAPGMAVAGLLGAAAALVKGPFGLLPVYAAAAARVAKDRSRAAVGRAAVVAFAATLPFAGFLLWSWLAEDRSWWDGYANAQLFASAVGRRTDGAPAPWFPLLAIAGRFWPGLALVGFGAYRLIRRRAGSDATSLRMVGLFALLVVVGLCLPSRKLWSHTLVAYPALSLFAALAVAGPAQRWIEQRAWQGRVAKVSLGLAVVAWMLVFAGIGGFWGRAPTPACGPLAEVVNVLPAGAEVVISPVEWRMTAALAAERRLVLWPVEDARAELPAHVRPRLVLLGEGRLPPEGGWTEVAQAEGWRALIPERAR